MRFTFTITHTPGKELTIADTLSRAPTRSASAADEQLCQDVEHYYNQPSSYSTISDRDSKETR